MSKRQQNQRKNRRADDTPARRLGCEPLMTIGDVAIRCGFSEKSARRWIASGSLPAVRIGRSLRVRPTDLDRFILSRLIKKKYR
jgi:excisionase family DNA binding protein